jgi:hypothetical protein
VDGNHMDFAEESQEFSGLRGWVLRDVI